MFQVDLSTFEGSLYRSWQVMGYLVDRGWRCDFFVVMGGMGWEFVSPEGVKVALPYRSELGAFSDMVVDLAIRSLAQFENRPFLDLEVEILSVSSSSLPSQFPPIFLASDGIGYFWNPTRNIYSSFRGEVTPEELRDKYQKELPDIAGVQPLICTVQIQDRSAVDRTIALTVVKTPDAFTDENRWKYGLHSPVRIDADGMVYQSYWNKLDASLIDLPLGQTTDQEAVELLLEQFGTGYYPVFWIDNLWKLRRDRQEYQEMQKVTDMLLFPLLERRLSNREIDVSMALCIMGDEMSEEEVVNKLTILYQSPNVDALKRVGAEIYGEASPKVQAMQTEYVKNILFLAWGKNQELEDSEHTLNPLLERRFNGGATTLVNPVF